MKTTARILALLLTMIMLVSVLAACGDNKDSSGSGNNASDNGGSDVAGAEQTWGEITVFVPDGLELTGGDTLDPENKKAVTLKGSGGLFDYIMITLSDSEDFATSSIDATKDINKDDNPTDITIDADGAQWTGITYNSMGTDCVQIYTKAGDKVYFVTSANYKQDDAKLLAVLKSLK